MQSYSLGNLNKMKGKGDAKGVYKNVKDNEKIKAGNQMLTFIDS